jgi:hypothetical protein
MPASEQHALDADDKFYEQQTRRAERRHTFSNTAHRYAAGPVRQIFVPEGHSRQTKNHWLRAYLREASEWDSEFCAEPSGGVLGNPIDLAVADCLLQTHLDGDGDDLPLTVSLARRPALEQCDTADCLLQAKRDGDDDDLPLIVSHVYDSSDEDDMPLPMLNPH